MWEIFLFVIALALAGYWVTQNSSYLEVIKARPDIPAPAVFAGVWSALYFLTAVSTSRALCRASCAIKPLLMLIFIVQMLINFLWVVVFFGMANPQAAFSVLVILAMLVLIQTILTFQIDTMAGWLLVPYLVWLMVAAALNYRVIEYP